MKKALTRILGLVLCFALLFAMIPATQAFAEGTIYRHWDSASGTLSFNTTAEGGTAITTLSTDTVLGNETSRSKILRVVFFCDIQISDGYMLFNGFTNLREIEGMSHVKTATVTDMRGMFKNCNSLTAIDLSYFDTTAVTKMSEMFAGCKSLKTLDLSQINTAKVTETYAMFRECSGLEKLDVGKFDTTYVTDMNGMFYGCSGLKTLDVSNFDTARVTDMGSMFCGCNGLTKLSLSNFDTSRVKSMWWMFSGCKNLTSIDMTGWNTANVGYWSYMFNGCSSLTELDVSTLNFSKGSLEMENMFQNCSSLHKLTVGAKFGYYANPDREARFPVDMVLSSGAQAFKAGSIIPQDITAKRTYIAAVEVKFNANGGKGTMSSQVFRFDEGSKALNANVFTKSGVSFVGWNTKADGTGTSYTDKQVLNYAKLGVSLTLYAQWKAVKPKITTQPVSVTASVGDKATFTVAASGSTPMKYRWQVKTPGKDWADVNNTYITGAKTATMVVPVTLARSGYLYRCVVTNAGGSTASQAAALSVPGTKPIITKQPANTSVTAGSMAKFTVAVSGTDLSYQWQVKQSGGWVNVTNINCSGMQTATLTVPGTSARNGNQYRCVVKNAKGSVTSSAATLTITAAAWPSVTKQPENASAKYGENVSFSIEATGTNLKYQWQVKTANSEEWTNVTNTACSGMKTTKLTVPATAARNGYLYRCVVSNTVGSVASDAAKLTVATTGQPSIAVQPLDVSAAAGTSVKFSVTANGDGLSYQWQVKTAESGSWVNVTNTACSGMKTATLTVPATEARNGYQYRCVVKNTNGSVTSAAGKLTVGVKPAVTKQPVNVMTADGTKAVFTVETSGTNLSYRWQVKSSASASWVDVVNPYIQGANTAKLTVPATLARNGYQYRCVISNTYGNATSSPATLNVF